MNEPTPAEIEEWKRAERIGQAKRRPLLCASLAGVVVAGIATAVLLWLFARAPSLLEAAAAPGIGASDDGGNMTLIFASPAVAGLAAFYAVYRLMGGRVAPEYERALRDP